MLFNIKYAIFLSFMKTPSFYIPLFNSVNFFTNLLLLLVLDLIEGNKIKISTQKEEFSRKFEF